jgi:3-methyladenine DNA glycosylase AlkD
MDSQKNENKSQGAVISARLRAVASHEVAAISQRFFKTAPGEYGAGDIFLGIKIPVLRRLAREYRTAGAAEVCELLQSRFHEERLFALLLMMQRYAGANEDEREALYRLYLASTSCINNWDLVDISAPHIVGRHLQSRARAVLLQLAASSDLWERRIAIIATLHFIRGNEFSDTLQIARMLLHDPHDLIHKAVGWMLREVGKRDRTVAEDFLKTHYQTMPRTMLRYAIERFPETLRLRYLHGKL